MPEKALQPHYNAAGESIATGLKIKEVSASMKANLIAHFEIFLLRGLSEFPAPPAMGERPSDRQQQDRGSHASEQHME